MDESLLARQFLAYSASKLRELASRIEACLDRLSEEQIWTRGKETENAVGNLVLHLCGNVGQWIVSTAGNRPDTRDRASEFAARGGAGKDALRARLRATVEDALAVIEALAPAQLAARHTIQGYDVSVLEAIYHVVEHFSMHTGQIIFATKLLTTADLGFYRHLEAMP
ncbi:MAG TPA: DinB family protein [Bryobacteraceae bacterium]|nr:DinB family protein [Bryobacteraceae bacterium]